MDADAGRRKFITRALSGTLALLGLGYLSAGLRTLAPQPEAERLLTWFPLAPEDTVPRAGVRKAELRYAAGGKERKGRVFLVASQEGLKVLSAVCSHLGCLVNYHKAKKEFLCPCHGGRYDLNGKNIAGPPPAPLTALPYRIEDGTILVGIRV